MRKVVLRGAHHNPSNERGLSGADDIINTSPAAEHGHGPRHDANLDKARVAGNTGVPPQHDGRARGDIAMTTDNQPSEPAASRTGPRRPIYIHELDDWSYFRWDPEAIMQSLARASRRLESGPESPDLEVELRQ